MLLAFSLSASSLAVGLAACDAGSAPTPGDDAATAITGCTPANGVLPANAPDGYYVNGNTVCTLDGKAHLFHGVDRPSLEWDPDGNQLSADDLVAMASWHANVVRVALNQDFWLSGSPQRSATYAARVDSMVQWAEAAGLDVILDLHWSDRGDFAVKPGQQPMADAHSIQFWQEVAARYKGDGRVLFELYNEPHDVPPAVWLSGGKGGQADYAAAGMQQLHDAVRGVGAENLIIVGGLNWAFDLSHVADYPVQGHNILYATHPYNNSADRQPARWSGSFGYLTKTAPVIVTEFGDGSGSCSAAWDQQLIAYADTHHVSWTAWAWWSGDCKFPSLLTDWKGGTTKEGDVVKAALLGYADPAPTRAPADAGADAAGE